VRTTLRKSLQLFCALFLSTVFGSTVTIHADDPLPLITIRTPDPVAAEGGGAAGQRSGKFRFNRTGPTTAALTVNFTVGGTATSGTDYDSLGTTVTFPAGSARAGKEVSTKQDTDVEGDETVVVTLISGEGYTIGISDSGTVTIQDDDVPRPVVTVAATDATAGEPGTGQGSGTFTFSRTGSTAARLTAPFSIGGTATGGTDYDALGLLGDNDLRGTVDFAVGSATATRTVAVSDDAILEGDETVIVTLMNSGFYDIGDPNSATVTIEDDDVPPPVVTVTATDATAGEPGTGENTGSFIFARTGPTTAELTANFIIGGTAVSGTDYFSLGTTVTFLAGQASRLKLLRVKDDSETEPDETVTLTVASGAGYAIGSPDSATVTIQDDDLALPIITVTATDATAGEPGTGHGSGTFTFTRSGSTTFVALTVNFTVAGTAISETDYDALGTTVEFLAGSATATKTVNVNDDPTVEGDETVILTVASGEEYTIGSPDSATATIQDDDAPLPVVTVTATDATAGEPGSGQGSGTFTFSRTGSTAAALTVNFTVGGTTTAGTDYAALGTTVDFAAGSATATRTVTVNDDPTVEDNETLILTVASGGGYTIGSPNSATVTVQDDDASSLPVITVTATDATAGEPGTGHGSGTFTFSRTGSTAARLTASFLIGGTATGGLDYGALGQTVEFAAGSTTTTKIVTVLDDGLQEGDQTVVVTLMGSGSYDIGDPNVATVVIKDDDIPLPVVTVTATDATAGEPGSSQGSGTFTFNRTGFIPAALTVNFTVAGTATEGSDYSALGTSVHFAAYSATVTKTVNVNDDATVEGNETVVLTLASSSDYGIGSPGSATVTIQDDDSSSPPVITLTAPDPAAGELGTGQGVGRFRFKRTGPTTAALTVNFTVGGTAINGTDYTSIGTSVVFAPGAADVTKTVDVVDDGIGEGDETVVVNLASGSAYIVGSPNSATVTIQDNDVSVVTVTATDATAGEPGSGRGQAK
jgi:hypothetical protein